MLWEVDVRVKWGQDEAERAIVGGEHGLGLQSTLLAEDASVTASVVVMENEAQDEPEPICLPDTVNSRDRSHCKRPSLLQVIGNKIHVYELGPFIKCSD